MIVSRHPPWWQFQHGLCHASAVGYAVCGSITVRRTFGRGGLGRPRADEIFCLSGQSRFSRLWLPEFSSWPRRVFSRWRLRVQTTHRGLEMQSYFGGLCDQHAVCYAFAQFIEPLQHATGVSQIIGILAGGHERRRIRMIVFILRPSLPPPGIRVAFPRRFDRVQPSVSEHGERRSRGKSK